VDWALTQNNLGSTLRERIRGERAENLEQAIAAFTAALEVFTPADFPVQRATTQSNLNYALRERNRGDRAENLERALAAYSPVPSPPTPAQAGGRLQAELAQAPLEVQQIVRQLGQPVTDLRQEVQRLQLFERALALVDRRRLPQLWAALQGDFANSLGQAPAGDRAENLERAIAAFSAVLEVYTRTDFPVQWATAQSNLGTVYSDRTFTAALEVYTRTDFPADWAITQNNLGLALTDRIRGDRADNLERAIAAFTAALEVRTRTDLPMDWAMTQNNLGLALTDRIRGDRAENLERAIAAFTAALEVFTPADFPVQWAMTQNNLGNALRYCIRGDRAENLERAIAAHTAALEVFTRADFPVQWATTQNNLGLALTDRIQGDRAENLERAIAAFTAALEVRTRTDFPVQWATTQNNLSNALRERIRGDRAENLERAIATFTAALEVRTRTDLPMDWAMTQVGLGIAYSERIQGDRAENLERAIATFTAVLEVYTRADLPMEWAMTQNNLGNALRDRIRGDRAENLEQAIVAFQDAVDGAQATGVREYERVAARSLGNLHYDEKQWSLAYTAFDTATAALEAMRTGYFTGEAKARLAEENAQLYARMTDTCLHLGRLEDALEWAEAGKGRLFLDQLGADAFPAPSLPPTQGPLLEREASLISELRALENAIRNAPDEDRRRQFVAQQGEKRAALDEMWAELEPRAPDYVALRRGDPVRYEQLQALVDGFDTAAALVEFYTLPDKIIVFVLRSRGQEPVVAQVPMSQDQLRRRVLNYFREVTEYPQRGDIGQRWQELAGLLLADVLPHLQGAELVYLVPHGLLHYLPLHALQVNGEYLIDRFPIAYAPSAAVLGRVIQRTVGIERAGQPKALVAGNPTLDLHYAESEAQQVAQLFGVQPYLREKATKATIQSQLVGKDVAHLACHGYFHPTRPLQSGVVFAGKEALTAHEIMGSSLQADLATLSACTTGLSEVGGGDELVGLPRALLYAGASSVLVSLWAVDDESTGQLMTDFYRRLYDDQGRKVKAKAVALREAMLETQKKRGHPYYWAPFILVGDWR
jgi:CHAT domain-containing protein/predicted LPLAT superfamily acyltransferase